MSHLQRKPQYRPIILTRKDQLVHPMHPRQQNTRMFQGRYAN